MMPTVSHAAAAGVKARTANGVMAAATGSFTAKLCMGLKVSRFIVALGGRGTRDWGLGTRELGLGMKGRGRGGRRVVVRVGPIPVFR